MVRGCWRHIKPFLASAPFLVLCARVRVYAMHMFHFMGSLHVSAPYLSFLAFAFCFVMFDFLLCLSFFASFFILCSHWSFLYDVRLIFSCSADHVPDCWQPHKILLGVVEAQSVKCEEHRHKTLIPPWEDQREWHRISRMTGPDCAVMCNLINTHTHTHTHTHKHTHIIIIIIKTRTRVHDEGGGISHEEAEGQRTRNKNERIRGTMDAGEDGR